jgi:hypothetical protein
MSYTKYESSDFVISSDVVTSPLWTNNTTVLTTFFTASSPTASAFYLDVYNTGSTLINSELQFSIAYCQISGSGSQPFNPAVPTMTPTRVNFGQYRNIIYGDNEKALNFGGTATNASASIVIAFDRNRYKESLQVGTFNLKLTSGSSNTLYLTDNSKDVSTVSYLDCGRVYYVVSGSNGTSAGVPAPTGGSQGYTSAGYYGLFLPDVGLIVLNTDALNLPTANGGIDAKFLNTAPSAVTTGLLAYNRLALFNFIKNGANFQIMAEETISSDYIFTRIKNSEYNYTTNPSFISGSGDLAFSNFIYNPQTFITTVGMYNDTNELLAVAKLSKPLPKDFTKETLIRVKLDW